jgi:transcriptional coactivator HFI1/ADA1
MNIATETYIKEFLTNMFGQVSENGPGYVKTAEYKRKVERDEAKALRGEIVRSTGGLLPSEVEEMRKRRPLCMEDLRLALELGDPYLGQVPIIAGQITNARFLDTQGIEEVYDEEPKSKSILLNGINGVKGDLSNGNTGINGYHVDLGDPMVLDDDWQWLGGGVGDVDGLDGVLDGCLAVGT